MLLTFFTFFTERSDARRVVTIGGWTPGLHRLVETRCLPCGCVTGVYETWSGRRLAIVDATSTRCGEHLVDTVLDAITPGAA